MYKLPKKVEITHIKGIGRGGRGIIATKKIKKGELIEKSPVILLGKKDAEFLEKETSDVLHYYVIYEEEDDVYINMLGYLPIYNHSNTPNAEMLYDDDKKDPSMELSALRDILPGEEITYHYGVEDLGFTPKK